jgi:MFS family permease
MTALAPSPTSNDSRRRAIVLGICCLSVFVTGVDLTIVNVALPSIGRDLGASVSGYAPLRAGLMTIPFAAAVAVCSNLSGRIIARRGPRLALSLAGLLVAIGSSLMSTLTAHTAIWFLVLAYVVFGAGAGLVGAPITNTALSGMPRDQAGVAGCGIATLVLGLASTGRWAQASARRNGERLAAEAAVTR